MRHAGHAGKLGLEYEDRWVGYTVFRLLRGEAIFLIWEEIDKNAAEGVEFRLELANGSREFHSVKRSKSKGDWTICALLDEGQIQSMLMKLGDPDAKFVFVSGTSSGFLETLCLNAREAKPLLEKNSSSYCRAFSERFEGDKRDEIENRLIATLGITWEELALKAIRLGYETFQESRLDRLIEQEIRFSFCHRQGHQLSFSDERLALFAWLKSCISTPVSRNLLLRHFEDRNLVRRHSEPSLELGDRLAKVTRQFTQREGERRIGERDLRPILAQRSLDEWLATDKPVLLVEGAGGDGKSSLLAGIASEAEGRGLAVCAFRINDYLDARTSGQLGGLLGIQDRPQVAVATQSGLKLGILVIDQLDAASSAAGGRGEVWPVIEEILDDVESRECIRIVLACRSFDLQTDPRFRRLRNIQKVRAIKVPPLTQEEVFAAFERAEINLTPSSRQLSVLSNPLNLRLFCEVKPTSSWRTENDLYHAYWDHLGIKFAAKVAGEATWSEVIGICVDKMRSSELLSIRRVRLEDRPRSLAALLSLSVLEEFRTDVFRFRFEPFFDFACARLLDGSDKTLADYLTELPRLEQGLHLRPLVRQTLAYFRVEYEKETEYLNQLRMFLQCENVRPHLRLVAFDWLGTLPDPTLSEWQILDSLPSTWRDLAIRDVPWDSVPWFDLLSEKTDTHDDRLADPDLASNSIENRLLIGRRVLHERTEAIANIVDQAMVSDLVSPDEVCSLVRSYDWSSASPKLLDVYLDNLNARTPNSPNNLYQYAWPHYMPRHSPETAGLFVRRLLLPAIRAADCSEQAFSVPLEDQLSREFFSAFVRADPLGYLSCIAEVFAEYVKRFGSSQPSRPTWGSIERGTLYWLTAFARSVYEEEELPADQILKALTPISELPPDRLSVVEIKLYGYEMARPLLSSRLLERLNTIRPPSDVTMPRLSHSRTFTEDDHLPLEELRLLGDQELVAEILKPVSDEPSWTENRKWSHLNFANRIGQETEREPKRYADILRQLLDQGEPMPLYLNCILSRICSNGGKSAPDIAPADQLELLVATFEHLASRGIDPTEHLASQVSDYMGNGIVCDELGGLLHQLIHAGGPTPEQDLSWSPSDLEIRGARTMVAWGLSNMLSADEGTWTFIEPFFDVLALDPSPYVQAALVFAIHPMTHIDGLKSKARETFSQLVSSRPEIAAVPGAENLLFCQANSDPEWALQFVGPICESDREESHNAAGQLSAIWHLQGVEAATALISDYSALEYFRTGVAHVFAANFEDKELREACRTGLAECAEVDLEIIIHNLPTNHWSDTEDLFIHHLDLRSEAPWFLFAHKLEDEESLPTRLVLRLSRHLLDFHEQEGTVFHHAKDMEALLLRLYQTDQEAREQILDLFDELSSKGMLKAVGDSERL